MIRDSIDCFGINHNFSENNQIGNIFPYFRVSVNDWIARLLSERNFMISKIDD